MRLSRSSVVLAAALAFALAACSSGGEEEAVTSTASSETIPLSAFPPEECVQRGWAQDPLLVDLPADPNFDIQALPDEQEVRAMDIVIGCFDRDTLVQVHDAVQTPFDLSTSSAECMADIMIQNQSGAAFIGFGHYTQDTSPVLVDVDLRSPTVAALAACVPPSAFGYGVVLQPFLAGNQNAAVDVACADRNYNTDADPLEFWAASYDQIVLDQNIEPVNRILYEPGLYCVSFGQAYAASVTADFGEDLSASTVACMDRELALAGAVEQLVTTGSNQDLINQAAAACLTAEERSTFGLDVSE